MSIVTLFGDEFSPLVLFRGGAVGFFHSTYALSSMFTDAAGTIPVTAVDDYVGKRNDLTANAIAFTQSTSTARPQYKGTYLKYDLTDDAMSATMPAIASGTVVILTSKGAWFDTFTSSSGAFAWGPTTYTGGPTGLFTALRQAANDYREIARFVINRSLTAAEKAQILAWAKPRGCPGEITRIQRAINGSFDTGISGWSAANTTLSWDSVNYRLVSSVSTYFGDAYQDVLTTGKVYLTSGKFSHNMLAARMMGVSLGNENNSTSVPVGQTVIFRSVATCGTPARIELRGTGSFTVNVGDQFYFDDISCEELVFP